MRAVSGFNASDDDVEPRRLRLWEALDVSDSAECSGEGGNLDVDDFDRAFERAPRGLSDLAGNTVSRPLSNPRRLTNIARRLEGGDKKRGSRAAGHSEVDSRTGERVPGVHLVMSLIGSRQRCDVS